MLRCVRPCKSPALDRSQASNHYQQWIEVLCCNFKCCYDTSPKILQSRNKYIGIISGIRRNCRFYGAYARFWYSATTEILGDQCHHCRRSHFMRIVFRPNKFYLSLPPYWHLDMQLGCSLWPCGKGYQSKFCTTAKAPTQIYITCDSCFYNRLHSDICNYISNKPRSSLNQFSIYF